MFVYLACGVISYLVLRALGELVLHRPSSGSFVSYAREFFGEKAAFVCGWVYWFGWAMAGIVDTTAVALYSTSSASTGPRSRASPNGCSRSSPWSSSCR